MVNRKKISIVGAGRVGSTAALWCFVKELGDVVLWNRTAGVAQGIALDMMEAGPLFGSDADITGTDDFRATKDSDVVVIAAGGQRAEGMSRDDLLLQNGKIVHDVTRNIIKYNEDAVIVVVTNPLDAMVYVAKHAGNLAKNKVVGMAGILDSSRFKSFIAKELKMSVRDVNALVLGSHGDEMIPLPAHTSVNGIPLKELLSQSVINKLINRTKNAGAEVIRLEQSSAFYSPGASVVEIIESIIKDKGRVLPCSAYLTGEYGIKNVCMGVPVRLGSEGIEEVVEVKLTPQEKKQFMINVKNVQHLIQILKKDGLA